MSGEVFAMTRIGDTLPYRGIEYGVHDEGQDAWHWAYYPKIGTGVVKRGQVQGTRETAIAACKAAIDEWLGPENSN
jgi:hypothetical protein